MNLWAFAARRQRVLEEMGERAVLVLPSAPVGRAHDAGQYRQDSDFFYLTGLDEPESVLVLTTAHPDHRCVVFVRPRDPAMEAWDGHRTGLEGAVGSFGADIAFRIDELDSKLHEYI